MSRLAWAALSLLVHRPGFAAQSTETGSPPLDSSRQSLAEGASESAHLTGDWGGWRTRLVQRGVHWQAGYIGEVIANVAGGVRSGWTYQGLAEAAVELDFSQLAGTCSQTTLRASALFPHGSSPSRRWVGDAQTMSNIDAYDGVSLYELWLEQQFFGDRASLRAGQLLADAEFAFTEAGGALINSSFGWPAFLSANTRNTGPAYPRAAPGARVFSHLGRDVFTQAAIYDGDTLDQVDGRFTGNQHGTAFHFSDDDGVLAMAELGWRRAPGTNEDAVARACKIGAWLHTGGFADRRAPERSHGHNHGIYLAAEHGLLPSRSTTPGGLDAFLRVGYAPSDRNTVEWACDLGLRLRSPLSGRPNDTLTLGLAAIWIGREQRQWERQAGNDVLSDREVVVEITYQCVIRPWWAIQPDIQWIHHPGASPANNHALALGLRTRMTF